MKQRLIYHVEGIKDSRLQATCKALWNFGAFFTCPASISFHHAYEGGLLAHTVEVCDIAMGIAMSGSVAESFQGCPTTRQLFTPVDTDILIAAALFHDLLKVNEYERSTRCIRDLPKERHIVIGNYPDMLDMVEVFTGGTDYQKTIGHICGSAAQFHTIATNNGVARKTIDAVVHCILAHHGRKDWGSPVEPQTLEALILHQADMISSKFGATKDAQP